MDFAKNDRCQYSISYTQRNFNNTLLSPRPEVDSQKEDVRTCMSARITVVLDLFQRVFTSVFRNEIFREKNVIDDTRVWGLAPRKNHAADSRHVPVIFLQTYNAGKYVTHVFKTITREFSRKT